MPTQKTDHLVQLINSLTKAEKRSFRLFVTRNQNSDEILFLKLFDEISKTKSFQEKTILERIPGIKKRQLSNLKAHLYKQLLVCLRMLARSSTLGIDIREKIDYARLLYDKGLYRQSLDILNKAKSKALEFHQYLLAQDILEFEKFIESQYITRSIEGRAEELKKQADFLRRNIERMQTFSNLSLQLYGLYLKVGHVRNKHDFEYLREFFEFNIPNYDISKLGFYDKLYLYQAHGWFHYMNQDFANYYKYCKKWYDLFEEYPPMKNVETALYLKSMHNLLTALYMSYRNIRFEELFAKLNDTPNQGLINNLNEENLHLLFTFIHLINKHFLNGTFTEGVKEMPRLISVLEENPYNWDHHRIMVFYYKIACMYFGSSDWNATITYLQKIINPKPVDFREDIQCFARILSLIAHFELGNQRLIEYQVKSVYRYLSNMSELQDVQKEIFRFLRRTPRMFKHELKDRFQELHDKLVKLQDDPYERRAFLYLDIISWLESKIEDKPVEIIIRNKLLAKQVSTASR